MSEPELTNEERQQIRIILARQNAGDAKIEVGTAPPTAGTWLGSVGRFTLWLVRKYGLWTLLLLPIDTRDLYEFYWPKIETAYTAAADFAERFSLGKVDPDSVPSTNKYIAFGKQFAYSPAALNTDPPPPITIIASTVVMPEVMAGSGAVPSSMFFPKG